MNSSSSRIVENTLNQYLSPSFVKSLLGHYDGVQSRLLSGDFEGALFKAGKFIETVLKGLHLYTTGVRLKRIEVGNEITRLENLPKGTLNESVRLLIPRLCRFVYLLASDRGGRHDITDFDPDKIDAQVAAVNVSFALAELIRVFHPANLSTSDAQKICESLLRKKLPLVFEIDGQKRLLSTGLPFKKQVLCLLYSCKTERAKESELLSWTEHSNASIFRRDILKPLHKNRLIEYREGIATLSPLGRTAAEEVLVQIAL